MMSPKLRIPLSKPDIGEEEIQAVHAVLTSNRLSFGPVTQEFEESFAELMGSSFAVAVNSGTSGLHLCMRAIDLQARDEVITSPFSFVASANCILYEQAKPVFVDVDPNSFNLDPKQVEAAITPRTKAILPVHVFGQCANMKALADIAQRHNLKVIEDACESPLASHHGRYAGTMGDAGVFGFYPNKPMTTGEGGIIITNNEAWYHLFRSLRNQGRGDDLQWLSHDRLGYNYRIHELTAALGKVQTRRLPLFIQQRRILASKYNERLDGIPGIKVPQVVEGNEHAWFVYGIRVKADIRDKLIQELGNRGIQSKAYFSPCIHLQPFYQSQFGYRGGEYPVAERLSEEMLILPFFPSMTDLELDYVVENLRELIERKIKN